MYRRKQTEDEWGFVGDVLKIALGVFIGSMAAWRLSLLTKVCWRGV